MGDRDNLPELPNGWAWIKVKEVIHIIDYRGRTPPYSDNGIPHIRSSNVRNGKIIWNNLKYVSEETYEKYMTRGVPKKGDLLFTIEAPLGEVALAPEIKFSVAQRMMILRSDVFTSKFLLYQIVSKGFQERLRGKGTGTTVTGVSSRNFKPLDIIIAPLAEQHRIVAKIEELFSELSARNIQDGWLSLDKVDYVPEHIYEVLARRLVIEPGDVLLSCSGSVGRSCVAPINLRFALVRSVAVLKPLAEMGKFISYSIRSPLLQRQIEEKKTQTAQANIFQEKIKVLIFAIPPLSEQHKIIEEVERCLSVTEELEKVINKNLKRAEKLRQSILKKAFEGKLVPQDPTDEPADKLLERIKAEKAKREAEAKAKKKQKQPGKSQQLELF